MAPKNKLEERIEKLEKTYGCSIDSICRINGSDVNPRGTINQNGPLGAYNRQKVGARARGIGWDLTLIQWWEIWEKSGKWDLRGHSKTGYVMARIGDAGGYTVSTVEIITHVQNVKDGAANRGHKNKPRERRNRITNRDYGFTIDPDSHFAFDTHAEAKQAADRKVLRKVAEDNADVTGLAPKGDKS